jgi:hypothetical protein
MIEFTCAKPDAAKWVEAIEAVLAENVGSEATGEFLRQGWLVREKKKFYFSLRG